MNAPACCDPLPTPEEINAWDKAAASMGLSTFVLMENASREALHALEELHGCLAGAGILCFAGPGNNGGDAIALARHAHDSGANVLLLLARPASRHTGAARAHLRLARRAGVDILAPASSRTATHVQPRTKSPAGARHLLGGALTAALARMPCPDIIVDGLLGTGLTGGLKQETALLIKEINRLGEKAFVFSLDIPSGLSGLTGEGAGAVRADATVTFEAAKLGLFLGKTLQAAGKLSVKPIGIPRAVRKALPTSHHLLTTRLARLLPGPAPGMHKGSAGKVLIIGGSPGLTGAPVLAALGALRAGAGLVTVACPAGLEPVLKAGNPDVMTLPLGQGSLWTEAMAEELAAQCAAFGAVVIGPGLGRSTGAENFLHAMAGFLPQTVARTATNGPHAPPHILWDADALFWLRGKRLPQDMAARCLFTPHPGEAAHLLDCPVQTIEAGRPDAVRHLAALLGGTVILKGAATLICTPPHALHADDPVGHALHGQSPQPPQARPQADVFLAPFCEANLAVGGSGDVLAGVCGTLLAQGHSPLLAACLGVYWHGFTGRLLSADFPYRGNLASEIARALPRALTEWHHAHSI